MLDAFEIARQVLLNTTAPGVSAEVYVLTDEDIEYRYPRDVE